MVQPAVTTAHALVGRRVGNFVITRRLRSGGMASVYLAEHPHIGKRVAIKILHAGVAGDRESSARFIAEARAIAEVHHPHVVEVVDFGHLARPTAYAPLVPYLALELLDGETLADRMDARRLTPGEAVHIIRQTAEALGASHAKGIVHRDLKPDNILLIRRGGDDSFVKLVDFGIAKFTLAGASSIRTHPGMTIGTPRFMSPEQCINSEKLDCRSDVYAVGLVLYAMLAGRLPFEDMSRPAVMYAHVWTRPPPPSRFAPDIPPALERIVMRCLAKAPADRYQTMEQLIAALDAAVGCAAMDEGAIDLADPTVETPPPEACLERREASLRTFLLLVILLGLVVIEVALEAQIAPPGPPVELRLRPVQPAPVATVETPPEEISVEVVLPLEEPPPPKPRRVRAPVQVLEAPPEPTPVDPEPARPLILRVAPGAPVISRVDEVPGGEEDER